MTAQEKLGFAVGMVLLFLGNLVTFLLDIWHNHCRNGAQDAQNGPSKPL